jgi:S1-C subfamily serine protease
LGSSFESDLIKALEDVYDEGDLQKKQDNIKIIIDAIKD